MTLVDRKATGHDRAARPGSQAYVLGYSKSELARLEAQAAFYSDLTEDLLRRAGIAPGMRVLDIGCGPGDVSLLAGALVGASGEVLGIDRSEVTVDIARRRAAAAGQTWVSFATAEIDALCPTDRFDAIVGRLILMYLPDPAATLRRLRNSVRPGGIVAFQEMAMPLARSVPDGALFRRCTGWIIETYKRSGFEFDMGGKLFAAFRAAGLPPQQIVAGRMEGGLHSFIYDYVAGTIGSLLPAMERFGVTTAAEVDVGTLAERLRREAVGLDASVMPPPLIGAWARLPG